MNKKPFSHYSPTINAVRVAASNMIITYFIIIIVSVE